MPYDDAWTGNHGREGRVEDAAGAAAAASKRSSGGGVYGRDY